MGEPAWLGRHSSGSRVACHSRHLSVELIALGDGVGSPGQPAATWWRGIAPSPDLFTQTTDGEFRTYLQGSGPRS